MDRSLGRHVVADALRKAGEQVEIHDDHFATNAPDEVWLRTCGQKGWIVLTKDKMVRKRFIEKEAILQAGVRAFIFTGGSLHGSDIALILVAAIPEMKKLIARCPPPFIATVTKAGAVSFL